MTRPDGIVAIIRLRHAEVVDDVVEALVRGGVRAIEATLPTPGSLELVGRWAGRDDALVGVGTVRTVEDLIRSADAGAGFVVTPTTVPAVIAAARDRGLPILAGALTPTEIDLAWTSGATMVKVFPIETVGGPGYIRAVAAPLDDVPLVPTGGITPGIVGEYRALGVPAVGVGSALVSEDAVRRGDWTGIEERARAFVRAWEHGG